MRRASIAFAFTLLAASLMPGSPSATGPGRYSLVPAGSEHTCVIDARGVQCWGANHSGQLGDRSNIDRNAPVSVAGLSGTVTAIVAGSEHTCAIVDGAVRCWGANFSGQLGDGSNDNRNAAVAVNGLPEAVVSIAAGGEHTCALAGSGSVWCWGANFSGQLGDGTNTARSVPARVRGLPAGVTSIAAGSEHTCAATSAGVVGCWGANSSGQLGDGTNSNRNIPVTVERLSEATKAITAGSAHTCALTTRGAVWCWGANWSGQLGDETNTNRHVPAPVRGLAAGTAVIAAGSEHTCAASSGGTVGCWGANFSGQLGNGSNANRNVPVDVVALRGFAIEVVAGSEHTCALTDRGDLECWGANRSGQLGDGTNASRSAPAGVSGVRAVRPTVRSRVL